jgi:hypothetical protein
MRTQDRNSHVDMMGAPSAVGRCTEHRGLEHSRQETSTRMYARRQPLVPGAELLVRPMEMRSLGKKNLTDLDDVTRLNLAS